MYINLNWNDSTVHTSTVGQLAFLVCGTCACGGGGVGEGIDHIDYVNVYVVYMIYGEGQVAQNSVFEGSTIILQGELTAHQCHAVLELVSGELATCMHVHCIITISPP